MDNLADQDLIRELRNLIEEGRTRNLQLARENADLTRHNKELREAIDALLQPAPSELLSANLTHRQQIATSDQ